ncbi:rhodanese-related sulfurtransferase [Compostibacter hankyongensis]|uniref:tRNA uridine(34) hydroxylase n=1 Tax=Compostibacter hankyongensis TaxID=1007089 RepID=A0ABP8FM74_9BACT
MILHNRVSAQVLKERLMAEPFRRITLSWYQYAHIEDPSAFRDTLYQHLDALQVFGRIYVAKEGINAQVSLPEHQLEAFRRYLNSIPFLKNIRLNTAVEDNGKSFWVLKIKVRDKIVADGISDPGFDITRKGKYLDAEAFNRLAADPDTVIVDMRNHYEYEVGHMEGALEVPADTFREQLPMAVELLKGQQDKNIVMYCTGGIRCEKASAWMLHNGFKHVYHLEGGIIHYTRSAREQGLPLKFRGKNFVFDERMGERVSDDIISRCHQCGKPCDTHTNCRNEGCHLLFIQCGECAEKYNGCCSDTCRDSYALPSAERQLLRKGSPAKARFFNKSRNRVPQRDKNR